jgi:predicted PurR-regulated permease PerM
MNEKNNIFLFVFMFVIGIVFGAVIINRFDNSKIDGLSDAISNGQEINRRLQLSNTYLSNINSRLTEEVGGLEKRIISNNTEYQKRLGVISSGLGEISKVLNGTGGNIQSVIDGLETIKIGLREIAKAK